MHQDFGAAFILAAYRRCQVWLANAISATARPVAVPPTAIVTWLFRVEVYLTEKEVLFRAIQAQPLEGQHLGVAHDEHQIFHVPYWKVSGKCSSGHDVSS